MVKNQETEESRFKQIQDGLKKDLEKSEDE